MICVTLHSLCDDETDCLCGDDELFCENVPECPESCKCLLFTISCTSLSLKSFDKMSSLSFLAIFFSNGLVESLYALLKRFPDSIILSLPNLNMTKICGAKRLGIRKGSIHYLDASVNLVHKLSANCFQYDKNIVFLNISHNTIREIRKHSFKPLSQLEILDIAFNNIWHLNEESFSGLEHLLKLNIAGNSLIQINFDSFKASTIKTIITENSKLCCIVSSKSTVCISKIYNKPCVYHIMNQYILIVMVTFNLLNLLLGLTVVILNALNIGDLGGYNFRATVILMSIVDILYNACLLILCSVNITYGTSYFEHEYYWKRHLLCYIISFTVTLHFMIYVFTTNLLAISSLQITRYPFDSKFVEKIAPKFLIRVLIVGIFLSIALSVFVTMLHIHLSGAMENGLCLILGTSRTSIVPSVLTISRITTNMVSMFTLPIIYYKTMSTAGSSDEGFQITQKLNPTKMIILSFRNHVGWLSECILLLIIIILDFDILLPWLIATILPFISITNHLTLTLGKFIIQRVKQISRPNKSVERHVTSIAHSLNVQTSLIIRHD